MGTISLEKELSDPVAPAADQLKVYPKGVELFTRDEGGAASALQRVSQKNAANGYPGLSAGSKIAGAQQTYGTGADTACEGNDARLSDERTDGDAIHDNVAGEISAITLKAVLVGADFVLVEDSEAADAKKGATLSAVFASMGFERARFDANSSTGIFIPGIVTINADPTKFDVSDGSGWIVDHYSGAVSVVTIVTWTGLVALDVTNLGTQPQTVLSINSGGTIDQALNFPTSDDRRDALLIGALAHPSLAQIDLVLIDWQVGSAPMNEIADMAAALGPISLSGNTFTANGANLFVDKNLGQTWCFGCSTSRKTPSVKPDPQQNSTPFQYLFTDSTSPLGFNGSFETVIDPNTWDNLTDVLQTVGSQKWSVQRLKYISGAEASAFQYGQGVFNSKQGAISSISSQPYVDYSAPGTPGLTLGFLVVRQGATDLSDLDQAEFFDPSAFSSIGGSSGSSPARVLSFGSRTLATALAVTSVPVLVNFDQVDSPIDESFMTYSAGVWTVVREATYGMSMSGVFDWVSGVAPGVSMRLVKNDTITLSEGGCTVNDAVRSASAVEHVADPLEVGDTLSVYVNSASGVAAVRIGTASLVIEPEVTL